MDIWTEEEEAKNLRRLFTGLNKAKFARDNAFPGGASMISQHLSGNRKIGIDAAIVYAKGFNCSVADISPRLSLKLSTASSNNNIEKSNVRRFEGKLGEVPKISWVKAGALCDVDDPFEPGDAKDWLICPVRHGPRTFALQVDGDSMDAGDRDSYPDGYDIFVDPDIEPRHGDDVVVRTPNGSATFKRLQINADGKYLLALNPQWPDRIVKVPEGTVICGVVIYSGKPRR